MKNKRQYNNYCGKLETLLVSKSRSRSTKEEIEMLTFLIEKWDSEHNSFHDLDPVQLLKSLMSDHNMKPVSLAESLRVSKGLVSDILNYKKGLSKEIIRKLADTFKLSHEAFNRHYDLVNSINGEHTHSGKVTLGRRVGV